jgi:hypothetical protein
MLDIEYILAIRNNNGNSEYSNHILNRGQSYWSITDTMKDIKIERTRVNTLDKYYIYIYIYVMTHIFFNQILESLGEVNIR